MMLACVLQQDRQQGGVHLACGPIGVHVKWQNLAIVSGTRLEGEHELVCHIDF